MKNIIAFDCDSTLSSIEGVDELARLAGESVFREVEDLTNQAMDGKVPVEEVFAKRLDLIRPTQKQCEAIGQMYQETIEPDAIETIRALQKMGWECLIISGGFAPCIQPLAASLGITRIEAVPLRFNAQGDYEGFDHDYPTTRSGGKPELIRAIRQEHNPAKLVMVGDGVSDLETTPDVDLFIGFFRYVERERVSQGCTHKAFSMKEIIQIVEIV